jgi:hypothetical protein
MVWLFVTKILRPPRWFAFIAFVVGIAGLFFGFNDLDPSLDYYFARLLL